jgi:hypothetical protein
MRQAPVSQSHRRRWMNLRRRGTVRGDSVGISEPIHRARYFAGGGVVRRCRGCGRPLYGSATLCRSRRCPEYGLIWAGDQRQKLFRNLEVLPGEILLGAVTAPGADALPWDDGVCGRLEEHVHSGRLGCRVAQAKATEWNESAPGRWRQLHRRAYQDTVKRCGRGSVWLVARVWEMQARGVLHVHPVLAYGTAVQMAGARFYVARLAELAPSYGFGFVERKVKPQPAVNAAAYLSSYFVKGRRGKATLWESALSGAMPRSIVHVSVRLTQETGCTMRLLRFARFVWVLWAVRLPGAELRVAHERGFMAWAELVAVESPDRGPPVSDESAG